MRIRRSGTPLLRRLATALVASVTVLQMVSPSSASAMSSQRRAVSDIAVVGRSTHYVVFNDRSRHAVYLANVGGRAAPRLLLRRARAVAVSGDLVEYVSHGTIFWRKLGTSRHGRVPARWTFPAPDGGLRVRHAGPRTYLEYAHLSGRVQRVTLPTTLPVRAARYSVVASKRQFVVAVSARGTVPLVVFSGNGVKGPYRLLNTTGLASGSRLRCDSVVAKAVGCTAGSAVVRLSSNRRIAPQVTILGPPPIHVAVTSTYTTWTASESGTGRACPCVLASIDRAGTAESIISGVTAPFVRSGYGRFYYTAGATARTAGVYATQYAGGDALRIAAAPRR